MRDLSEQQLLRALERRGVKTSGPLWALAGYVTIPTAHGATHVSVRNGGTRRRDQLAYVLRERDRILQGDV
jgi:hypothetical protein